MKPLVSAVLAGVLLTLGVGAFGQSQTDPPLAAQSAADACRTAGVSETRQASDTGFTDLEATSAPVADAVRCLVSLGVIDGPEADAENTAFGARADADTAFLNGLLSGMKLAGRIVSEAEVSTATRGDFAVAIDNILGTVTDGQPVAEIGETGWAKFVPPARDPHPLADAGQVQSQYAAILKLYETRITLGYADGTFQPARIISRGEAALMARRALDYVNVRTAGVSIYMERYRTDTGNGELVIFDDAGSVDLEATVFGDGFAPVKDARVDVAIVAPGEDVCDDPACEIDGGDPVTGADGTILFPVNVSDIEDGSRIRVWTGELGDTFSDTTEYAEVVVSLRAAADSLTVEASFKKENARKAKFGETASVVLTVADADGEPVDYSGLPETVIANYDDITCSLARRYAAGGNDSGAVNGGCALELSEGKASRTLEFRETKPATFAEGRTSTQYTLTVVSPTLDLTAAGGENPQDTPTAMGMPATVTFPADARVYTGTAANSAVVGLEWTETSVGLQLDLTAGRWTECAVPDDAEYPWACSFASKEGDGASGNIAVATTDDFGNDKRVEATVNLISLNDTDGIGSLPVDENGVRETTAVRPNGRVSLTRDNADGLVEYFRAQIPALQRGECPDDREADRDATPPVEECEEDDGRAEITAVLEFYWASKIERGSSGDPIVGDIAFRGSTNVVFSSKPLADNDDLATGNVDDSTDGTPLRATRDGTDGYYKKDGSWIGASEVTADNLGDLLYKRVAYFADFSGTSQYNIAGTPATQTEWEKALTEKDDEGDFMYKVVSVEPDGKEFLKFDLLEALSSDGGTE